MKSALTSWMLRTSWWSLAAPAPPDWADRRSPRRMSRRTRVNLPWSSCRRSIPATWWATGRRTETRRSPRRARPAAAAGRGCTPRRSAASPLCSSSCWRPRWGRAPAGWRSRCWPASPGSSPSRSSAPRRAAAAAEDCSRNPRSWASACSAAAPGRRSAASSAAWTPTSRCSGCCRSGSAGCSARRRSRRAASAAAGWR